jgi:hypothetical protein
VREEEGVAASAAASAFVGGRKGSGSGRNQDMERRKAARAMVAAAGLTDVKLMSHLPHFLMNVIHTHKGSKSLKKVRSCGSESALCVIWQPWTGGSEESKSLLPSMQASLVRNN